MSTTRGDFEGRKFEIFVNGSETFQYIIINPETGEPQDMSNTTIWNNGETSILKPSGEVIGTVIIVFSDRSAGAVDFTIEPPITDSENAGNWIGFLEIKNSDLQIIAQQNFAFNIKSKTSA